LNLGISLFICRHGPGARVVRTRPMSRNPATTAPPMKGIANLRGSAAAMPTCLVVVVFISEKPTLLREGFQRSS
jgi:hypothetical protein